MKTSHHFYGSSRSLMSRPNRSDLSEIQDNADGLGASGGTYLFDSIVFAIDSIGSDVWRSAIHQHDDVGVSLVVISDGMDYMSLTEFEPVL